MGRFGCFVRGLREISSIMPNPPGLVSLIARLSMSLNLLHEFSLFLVNAVVQHNASLPANWAAALGHVSSVFFTALAFSLFADAAIVQPTVQLTGHIFFWVGKLCAPRKVLPPKQVAQGDEE